MVYSYLPFMILPLYANLEKLDTTLNEAAMDLGSRPWQVFKDVTLPLSVPGILAGGLLVFIPASGELIIPSLVGNASDPMIGRVISDTILLCARLANGFGGRRGAAAAAGRADDALHLFRKSTRRIRARPSNETPSHLSHQLPVLRLRLLLHSDPVDDRLLLQQVAAGDGVGWLLDAVVRQSCSRTTRS